MDANKEYACYSCGEVNGAIEKDETLDLYLCLECNHHTILSINGLIDVAGLYFKKYADEKDLFDLYEEYMDLI